METQDRSEQQKMTPESMGSLRETIRLQEAALQTKGRLIDNMAYQIRTLSNAIVGFSDLLLTEDLSEDQRDYADEINRAGKGLSELVNEMLDWARLGSGRLQIVRNRCALATILEELRLSATPAAEEKALVFGIHQADGLPETLVTDADRLLKCLINLTANAILFTEEGYVKINVRSEDRAGVAFVRFDIVDSGPGIAADKLATLFEPAMREADANAQVVTMLGRRLSAAAGLPPTHQLAELLGGTLEVQSDVGRGSTFSLLIPTEAVVDTDSEPDTPVPTNASASDEPTSNSEPLAILLVEDQESNRTVVQLMLQTMGFEVDTAVDGLEAVAKAESRRYGLILMDLKMPRMNGYDAAETLRNNNIKAAIVALTAMSIDSDEKQKIMSIFDDFLSKPVDSRQLSAIAQKYIKQTSNASVSAL